MIEPTREALLACLHVERWADALAARAYATMLELERAAVAAATPLSPAEIDEALAAHPRIGDRRDGDDAEARFSREEQSASASGDCAQTRRTTKGVAARIRRARISGATSRITIGTRPLRSPGGRGAPSGRRG